MVNWSTYRKISIAGIAIFLVIAAAQLGQLQQAKLLNKTSVQHSKIWGFYGHQRINRVAVFTLPPEMFGFYKEHIEYLTEHAVDPDKRRYAVKGEAECHFIDLDHYYKPGENIWEMMPQTWKGAVEKYTEDTLLAYGIVPWHIQIMKNKLKRAFESKNIDLILKYSAEIGHYIGDAHVPLHTSENYNGQMTGQKGIHGLWESRLVEIHADEYNYFVGKAEYLNAPLNSTWDAIKGSHAALDSVLRFEKELTASFPSDRKYSYEQRGNTTIQTYSKEFSDAYHQMLNGMVERRMRAAIISVGSFWYSAWVDAGQPDLTKLQHTPPSADLLKEFQQLEAEFNKGNKKGRACDDH